MEIHELDEFNPAVNDVMPNGHIPHVFQNYRAPGARMACGLFEITKKNIIKLIGLSTTAMSLSGIAISVSAIEYGYLNLPLYGLLIILLLAVVLLSLAIGTLINVSVVLYEGRKRPGLP